MTFLEQTYYPTNKSTNRIKEQRIINNKLYIIVLDEIIWKLYLYSSKKKKIESRNIEKLFSMMR